MWITDLHCLSQQYFLLAWRSRQAFYLQAQLHQNSLVLHNKASPVGKSCPHRIKGVYSSRGIRGHISAASELPTLRRPSPSLSRISGVALRNRRGTARRLYCRSIITVLLRDLCGVIMVSRGTQLCLYDDHDLEWDSSAPQSKILVRHASSTSLQGGYPPNRTLRHQHLQRRHSIHSTSASHPILRLS